MKRLFVLLCSVAFVAGACSSGGSTDIKLIVAGAADKTVAQDTAKMEMTIKVVGDETQSIVINGAIDFERDLTTMKFDIEDQKLEAIIDDKAMYYKVPDIDLPDGKSWLKMSFKDIKKAGGANFGALSATGQDDPASTLNQLRGADEVKEIGSETVRGTSTTHYRATVDLEEAAKQADPAEAKAIRAMTKQLGITTQPFDVWLDDEDRVWRVVQEIDFSKAKLTGDEAQLKSAIVTMELYDFGSPIGVKIPSSEEVVDFKDVLGDLPGDGTGSGEVTAATTALEPRLLTASLPGYTREADDVGDTGPSDLEKAIRDDGDADARAALTSAGFVAGYQRLWSKADNQIVDFVYQFKTSGGAAAYFQRSVRAAEQGDDDVTITPFAVTGIPGAKGFSVKDGEDDGAIVMFTRGAYFGQILLYGSDATPANATQVAKAQYNKLG